MTAFNFNPNQWEASRSFELIEAGWYDAKVIKSERRPNKAGTAERLNFQFQIIGGKHNGRIVFLGLNYGHPDPKTNEISMGQMKSMYVAMALRGNIGSTEQFHNIPHKIKVAIDPAKDGFPERNEIKEWQPADYKPTGGMAPAYGGGSAVKAPGATSSRPGSTSEAKPAGFARPASGQAQANPAQSRSAQAATGRPGQQAARPKPVEAAPVVEEEVPQAWEDQGDQYQDHDQAIANHGEEGEEAPWG